MKQLPRPVSGFATVECNRRPDPALLPLCCTALQDKRMDYKSILTRSALVSSINSMNLLSVVPAEVRSAYELLTNEFNPLELCKKLDPLLTSLEVRAGGGGWGAEFHVPAQPWPTSLQGVGEQCLNRIQCTIAGAHTSWRSCHIAHCWQYCQGDAVQHDQHMLLACCACVLCVQGISSPMSSASPVKDLAMALYVPSLKRAAVLRALKQLSDVYSTMTIKELGALVPFMSFADVEAVVVDAVKYEHLQVRQKGGTHRAAAV